MVFYFLVHLLAIAGRLGIKLTLDDFDKIGSNVPLLANLQPARTHLMEDFFRAGGLLALLKELKDLMDPKAITVTGKPLVDYLGDAEIFDETVISKRSNPLKDSAGIAVIFNHLHN